MGKGKRRLERIDANAVSQLFVKDFPIRPLDRKIIEIVYRLRAVRTSHFVDLTGITSVKYIRDRLRDLYKNRFIDRRYYYEEKIAKNFLGSAEGVHFLDDAGKLEIAGMYELDIKQVKWRAIDNEISWERVQHTLKSSEIVARIAREARAIGAELIDYWGEKHLWKKFEFDNKILEFCPDIYVKIRYKGDNHLFFIENDTGTMSINTFTEKISKYDAYKLSKAYERDYEDFPKVLVLTSDRQRAGRLAQEVQKQKKTRIDWLFSFYDYFDENPFGSDTFLHTSFKMYSMFDKIEEKDKTLYKG